MAKFTTDQILCLDDSLSESVDIICKVLEKVTGRLIFWEVDIETLLSEVRTNCKIAKVNIFFPIYIHGSLADQSWLTAYTMVGAKRIKEIKAKTLYGLVCKSLIHTYTLTKKGTK